MPVNQSRVISYYLSTHETGRGRAPGIRRAYKRMAARMNRREASNDVATRLAEMEDDVRLDNLEAERADEQYWQDWEANLLRELQLERENEWLDAMFGEDHEIHPDDNGEDAFEDNMYDSFYDTYSEVA